MQLYFTRLRKRDDPKAAVNGLRRQLDALGVAPADVALYLQQAKKQAPALGLLPQD